MFTSKWQAKGFIFPEIQSLSKIIKTITCYLFDSIGPHVQQHGAVEDAAPQLKQAV